MKTWFVILAGVTGLLSPYTAFAAKDAFQDWQQQRFVKEKRAQEAERRAQEAQLAQLRALAAESAAQSAAAMAVQH